MAMGTQVNPSEVAGGHFIDYLKVLSRRKGIIIPLFSFTLLLTVILTIKTKPLYEARALLMIEDQSNTDFLGLKNSPLSFKKSERVQNQVEILRSSALLSRVIENLPPEVLVKLYNPHYYEPAELIKKLKSHLFVKRIRETDMISLGLRANDPSLALKLTESFAQIYEDYNLEQSRAQTKAIRQFIESQLAVVSERLKESENALKEFKEKNRLSDLKEETRALIEKAAEITKLKEITKSERLGNQERYDYLKSLIEKEREGITNKLEKTSSPLITALKNNLDQLEIERANLIIQGFSETHPRIKTLDSQIEEIRIRLGKESEKVVFQEAVIDPLSRLKQIFDETFEAELEQVRIRAREKALERTEATYERIIKELPERERKLAQLTRDVEVSRQIYSLLSERYEEARIEEAGKLSEVKIIDIDTQAKKVRPNITLNLLFGLIVGITLAVGAGLSAEYIDTSVKERSDLERLNIPVLANIPVLNKIQNSNGVLITEDSNLESFRVLRTAILFSPTEKSVTSEKNQRCFVVTSAGVGEGKSTVAVNLSVVLAQAGSPVLLIDGDLRRPNVHSAFGLKKQPGFSDGVVQHLDPKTIIHPIQANLSVITAGTKPPSPADIFSAQGCDEFLSKITGFRYIIFDTPPVLSCADTSILAAKMDGVIFIARAKKTPKEVINQSLTILKQAGAKILGAVLNFHSLKRRYDYYYYYNRE